MPPAPLARFAITLASNTPLSPPPPSPVSQLARYWQLGARGTRTNRFITHNFSKPLVLFNGPSCCAEMGAERRNSEFTAGGKFRRFLVRGKSVTFDCYRAMNVNAKQLDANYFWVFCLSEGDASNRRKMVLRIYHHFHLLFLSRTTTHSFHGHNLHILELTLLFSINNSY